MENSVVARSKPRGERQANIVSWDERSDELKNPCSILGVVPIHIPGRAVDDEVTSYSAQMQQQSAARAQLDAAFPTVEYRVVYLASR